MRLGPHIECELFAVFIKILFANWRRFCRPSVIYVPLKCPGGGHLITWMGPCVGHLNGIFARVGGNLNNNFQKSQMPRGLSVGGVEASIWPIHYTAACMVKWESDRQVEGEGERKREKTCLLPSPPLPIIVLGSAIARLYLTLQRPQKKQLTKEPASYAGLQCSGNKIPFFVTWDQAQFERFSYILYNGYRWNFRLARRNVIFKAERK